MDANTILKSSVGQLILLLDLCFGIEVILIVSALEIRGLDALTP